jgi:hypothetical protein
MARIEPTPSTSNDWTPLSPCQLGQGGGEEEIQKFILSDPNNEIINLYQDKNELCRMHYYIRVIFNNPMGSELNLPQLYLENMLKKDLINNLI